MVLWTVYFDFVVEVDGRFRDSDGRRGSCTLLLHITAMLSPTLCVTQTCQWTISYVYPKMGWSQINVTGFKFENCLSLAVKILKQIQRKDLGLCTKYLYIKYHENSWIHVFRNRFVIQVTEQLKMKPGIASLDRLKNDKMEDKKCCEIT